MRSCPQDFVKASEHQRPNFYAVDMRKKEKRREKRKKKGRNKERKKEIKK